MYTSDTRNSLIYHFLKIWDNPKLFDISTCAPDEWADWLIGRLSTEISLYKHFMMLYSKKDFLVERSADRWDDRQLLSVLADLLSVMCAWVVVCVCLTRSPRALCSTLSPRGQSTVGWLTVNPQFTRLVRRQCLGRAVASRGQPC